VVRPCPFNDTYPPTFVKTKIMCNTLTQIYIDVTTNVTKY
jgi:hypothetical protein